MENNEVEAAHIFMIPISSWWWDDDENMWCEDIYDDLFNTTQIYSYP